MAGGLGALALLAIALALSIPASAATVNVSIVDYAFSPQNITIEVGDTVNWTNTGTVGHDVHFEAGFGSGSTGGIAPGASFEYMFMAPGVFKYHCVEHSPSGFDPPNTMIGRVTVLDSGKGPSASFTSTPPASVGPNATLSFAGLSTDNTSVTAVAWQVNGGAVQTLAPTP